MKKESAYVTLTRYRHIDQLRALRPLVEENETVQESHAYRTYMNLLQTRNFNKEAEMRRLIRQSRITQERHAAIFTQLQ